MNSSEEARVGYLRFGPKTEKRETALRPNQLPLLDIPIPGAKLAALHHEPQPLLALLQRVFGVFATGDVVIRQRKPVAALGKCADAIPAVQRFGQMLEADRFALVYHPG